VWKSDEDFRGAEGSVHNLEREEVIKNKRERERVCVLTQWGATLAIKIRERERERSLDVLTQWGATLVIKIREREN
jgi:hypothetical protein